MWYAKQIAVKDHNPSGKSSKSKKSEEDIIQNYYKSISKYPLLSYEEEQEIGAELLALRKQDISINDKRFIDVRSKLVNTNLRFVISIAKKYQGFGLSLEDLIQEGNVGLMKAAEGFDCTKGARFTSYAGWLIRQAILRGLAEKGKLIREPVHVGAQNRRFLKAEDALKRNYSGQELDEKLAEYLNITVEKVKEIRGFVSRHSVQSLDIPVGNEEQSGLVSILADSTNTPVDINVINKILQKEIREILPKILKNKRGLEVIKMRFGIGYNRALSLEKIGEMLGVSPERIRQIETNAMRKLKTSWLIKRLDPRNHEESLVDYLENNEFYE